MRSSASPGPLSRIRRSPEARERRLAPRVVHHEVSVPGLDPAHDGLRVAHLTDIHVGMLTPPDRVARAVRRAVEAKPDLTVLTGDYLCYSPRFVERFRRLIGGIPGPVYAVLGNHDYWTDAPALTHALEGHGYVVLRNQNTRLDIRGAPLHIVGIDDAVTGHADAERAFRGVPPGARSRLVLTHVPGMADAASRHGPSLALAGHTHGGHINIPQVTARIARRLGNHYLAGFYRLGDTLLYVNRGVGSSSIPIRAGAPSEVAILALRAASPPRV